MKTPLSIRFLSPLMVVIGGITGARAENGLIAETATGDPLVTFSNVGLGFEYTHDASSKEKYIPNVNWLLGKKTGCHDWSLGLEMPVWVTQPKDGPDQSGMGDLKLRLTHLWVDNKTWLVGNYAEVEFDTAADAVQSVANQRNLLTIGSGFIRHFDQGWAIGGTFQYGWSTNTGESNGWKSEWEGRLGIRKKLLDHLSFTTMYKGTYDVTGGAFYSSSLEPSLAMDFGKDSHYTLWLACELPLQGKSEDYTAKASVKWLF